MARDGELQLDPTCSRCGAPIVDRSHAVSDAIHAFCCGNCSAAGVAEEPISPEAEA